MSKLFPTKNHLPVKVRKQVVDLLNQTLADLIDLHAQTKHAHWNVRGQYFYSLHLLFDQLAGTMLPHIDPLAERIAVLGGVVHGTIRQAAASSALKEFPTKDAEGLAYVHALVERYSQAGTSFRAAVDKTAKIGDADTSDLLTAISRDVDKSLWFLESHLR